MKRCQSAFCGLGGLCLFVGLLVGIGPTACRDATHRAPTRRVPTRASTAAPSPRPTRPALLKPAPCAAHGVAVVPVQVPAADAGDGMSQVSGIDLDGDGADELALASVHGLVILRLAPDGSTRVLWQAPAHGGATSMTRGDLDGDGRDDLVVGWGVHRTALNAPAHLSVYLSRGAKVGTLREESIPIPPTPRAQFASLQVTRLAASGPVGLLFAYYASKYDVQAVFATRRGKTWQQQRLDRLRMAAHWAAGAVGPTGAVGVYVGRPYGDGPQTFGDVAAWTGAGKRRLLPSVRGVRSLAVVRLGTAAAAIRRVCYGAGWHWQYRAHAQGILMCSDGKTAQIIDTTGGFEVGHIAAADLDGDGVRELVASGPDGMAAYTPVQTPAGLRWRKRVLGPGSVSFTVLHRHGRALIVTAGARPMLLRTLPPAPAHGR